MEFNEKLIRFTPPLMNLKLLDITKSWEAHRVRSFIGNFLKDIDPTDQPRMLFVMPEAAGDVLLSTAITASLKEKYPDHDIYFCTNENYKSILKDNKDIHKVIGFSRDVWEHRYTLSAFFDLVFFPSVPTQEVGFWQHTKRDFIQIYADYCGVEPKEPKIAIEEIEHPYQGQDYVILHALNFDTTKNSNRAWPVEKWQQIADDISQHYPIIQIGTAQNPKLNNCYDMRDISFQESAYLMKNCKFFIGLDSFPVHLAATFHKPTVALFANTYPDRITNKKYYGKFIPVTPRKLLCEKPCHQQICFMNPENPCIQFLELEDVQKAVKEMIKWLKTQEK